MPDKWPETDSQPQLHFRGFNKEEESRQDGANEGSIEGGDSVVHLRWRMEAKDKVGQGWDESSDSAAETGFNVTDGNRDQEQDAQEWIIDKNCLEIFSKVIE